MEKNQLKKLVQVAVLISAEILLSRFLSISTFNMKIGFGFLPIALAGMLYGPLWAGGAAALADLLGATLFPIGPYFPGFTLTAGLTGLAYGLLLYKKRTWLRIILCVAAITLGFGLCLNSYWISLLYGKGFIALLPSRLLQSAVMTPIQIILLRVLSKRIYLFSGMPEAAEAENLAVH